MVPDVERIDPTWNAQELDGLLLTVPDAARRLGIGRRQIDRAIEAGLLDVYELGAWPRVSWTEVIVWLEGTRRARVRPSVPERRS